jgi:DNA-directed RNA polymerase subunit beta'
MSFVNETRHDSLYQCVKISLASPEQILKWSHGHVKSAETINYRTFKPEKDGLFCARIFGPVNDYECLCQKYRKIKYKGIICEKCGVEVIQSKVRRERMGHIELAYPVLHTWFLYTTPSKLSTVTGLQQKIIEKIIIFTTYLVIDGGQTRYSRGDVLTEQEYEALLDEYDEDAFNIKNGSEAILEFLETFDLEAEITTLYDLLKTVKSSIKKTALLKRLSLLEQFQKSKNKLKWMVITILPVLPPGLRPLLQIDSKRFATSDFNELYRRLINRNLRLKSITDLDPPEVIVRNEKIMLQEAVDALFDNSKRTKVTQLGGNRMLKSLSDQLSGKQGIFRQNLLGKRIDYSARSVITVGPNLRLHQCGLPKQIAVELFRPFIYHKLEIEGKASSIKSAKAIIDSNNPEVWEILEGILRDRTVLLNRAPTLHRLGIQAFEPILINSKAIQLHPLVCSAFNADFDGDQMAVHVPISTEAQVEAKLLMLSSNNVISPSSGTPIITPSQDMIMGIFYATNMVEGEQHAYSNTVFSSLEELEFLIHCGEIFLNSPIKYIVSIYDEEENLIEERVVETTYGRVSLYNCLPSGQGKIPFEYFNKPFIKKDVNTLFTLVYELFTHSDMVLFADKVMRIGFRFSTKSGISFTVNDIKVPETKKAYLEKTTEKIKEFEAQLASGFITSAEKRNKSIDAWQECINRLFADMMKGMSKNSKTREINSIYLLAYSGARGSTVQMKQLASMRGLITKPNGEIIETPVLSNFKEGLSTLEYFISAHGARKGLADTALKTADAGYLTRRLVDVSHNCIVTQDDCGTTDGIVFYPERREDVITKALSSVVYGRVLAEDIVSDDKSVVIQSGTLIDKAICKIIDELGLPSLKVRSVVCCTIEFGVCQKCYGKDPVSKTLITIGEPVGVIAAQSIGEPGTQLTMRTFHVGGVAVKSVENPTIVAEISGKVKFEGLVVVKNKHNEFIVLSTGREVSVEGDSGRKSYKIPTGAKLLVEDGQSVEVGDVICEFDPYSTPIISSNHGYVSMVDLKKDISYKEVRDDTIGSVVKTVIESSLHPRILLHDAKAGFVKSSTGINVVHHLPSGAILTVDNEAEVYPGDILAKVPKAAQGIRDITGGLPRVVDLLEARKLSNPAIISLVDGLVSEIKVYHSKKIITVRPHDSEEPVEYVATSDAHILVNQGFFVKKGDILVDGNINPHDILKVRGVNALVAHILEEIQSVYKLQGVEIDNKHFEVIIKYMLQKISISEPGDTHFIQYQKINKYEFARVNAQMIAEGKQPAKGDLIFQGITPSSLQTDSFISAASFQETTRVLTEAAFQGKTDNLTGIKENVIIGKLIPVGTGFSNYESSYFNERNKQNDW